jgi:dUTP pyrophosphatase
LVIKPNERVIVPTGLYFEIEPSYFVLLRPRSGLAAKHGICLSSSGVIDSDYRQEVGVPLINLSNKEFIINNGDRIAQMLVLPVLNVDLIEVDKLSDSNRSGGYGSTGK